MDQSSTNKLTAHFAHMRRTLANCTADTVITVADLFGGADVFDQRIVLATRTFVSDHRSMGLRVGEVDCYVANQMRAQTQANKATNGLPVDDRQSAVYEWVKGYFDTFGCTVDCSGNIHHARYNSETFPYALTVLNSDLDDPRAQSALTSALSLLIQDRRLIRIEEIKDDISTRHLSAEARDAVQQSFVSLLTWGLDPATNPFSPEEAALLVYKTIWQVKRKLHNIPVTRHTMLVLVGPQEAGKSSLIQSMIAPVRELTADTDLRAITDDRNIQLFKNYVGVVDELDKADRTNVETLKSVITHDTMVRRVMYSNGSIPIKQNMTFVGTSNRDVAEVIVDETGNRRFLSLTVIGPKHPNNGEFWAAVREMDWLALWRSVDETAQDPTLPIMAKINATQRLERSKSFIESWLEHDSDKSVCATGKETSTKSLYLEFRCWEDVYAPQYKTNFLAFSKAFARMAKHNLIPFEFKKRTGSNGYVCTAERQATLIDTAPATGAA